MSFDAPVMATSTNSCLDLSRNVQASADHMAVDECKSTFDELVKFLMSRNISIDVIKDSHFQNLLKTVAQHGQQSCVFLENYSVVQKSLGKFEQEIKQYMRTIIQSWKTTGCTLMSYNMKGAQQNKCVVGFYCPKGFIFLEVGPSKEDIENALAELVPDSSYGVWKDIIQFVEHDASYYSECPYQALHLTGKGNKFTGFLYGDQNKCIRQQIHELWMRVCKASTWVQSLIRKSDKIFECLVTRVLTDALFKTLKQKGVREVAGWKHASSFTRLRMVMKVRSELPAWRSLLGTLEIFNLQNDTEVMTTINNNDFWNDGNELIRVFTPFFEIPNLMDTVVPSAGYLFLALDKASALLKTYSVSEPYKYEPILECFKSWRDNFDLVQDLTCYLNPAYFLKQEDISLQVYKRCFYGFGLDGAVKGNKEELLAELDAYCTKSSNPFADVSMTECEANHPATLWSKYGGGFPLMQKCAFKFLSQPAGCLCKQVEKHISKIQGSDNYILRLNGLMMEEFTKLGDQIYQPIHI